MEPNFVTVATAATLTMHSKVRIYRLIQEGKVRSVKGESSGITYVSLTDLFMYFAKGTSKPAPEPEVEMPRTLSESLKVLEIAHDGKGHSMDDIKTAYRKLARIHHPDVGGTVVMMQVVNAAYEVCKRWYSGRIVEA